MNRLISELDPESPEAQIHCAITEGMANIFRAVFGEGIEIRTTYELLPGIADGKQFAHAKTVCVKNASGDFSLEASVPIAHPDREHGNYRIADEFFAVTANDTLTSKVCKAWCENNPSLGEKALVKHKVGNETTWTIADSMECEVLYTGPFDGMPDWAKQIVVEKEVVLANARRFLTGIPDGDG